MHTHAYLEDGTDRHQQRNRVPPKGELADGPAGRSTACEPDDRSDDDCHDEERPADDVGQHEGEVHLRLEAAKRRRDMRLEAAKRRLRWTARRPVTAGIAVRAPPVHTLALLCLAIPYTL